MKTKLFLLLTFMTSITVLSQSINQTKQMTNFTNSKEVEKLKTDIKKNKEVLIEKVDKKDPKLNDTITIIKNSLAILEANLKKEKDSDKSKLAFSKHYDKLLKAKQVEIDKLYTDLDSAIGGEKDAFKKIQNKITKAKAELEALDEEKKNELASLEGNYSSWFPSFKRLYRQQFFESMYNKESNKTKYINSFALSANSQGALAQSEIITDNLSALRISFGSIVTSSSEKPTDVTETQKATENDALKRLITGGGNFYLELLMPLATTNNENKGWVTMYTYANIIGASDVKGFGNNIDTSSGNGSLGITQYLGGTSDTGKFNFFVQGNLNYTMGSKAFYKNLGLNNEKGFLNGKFVAGLTINNTLRFSAIISSYGSDEKVRSGNVILGVQILPSL